MRRGKPPRMGQWSLPGGAQHVGETAEAAARRELHEETGIEVGPLALATWSMPSRADEDGRALLPLHHHRLRRRMAGRRGAAGRRCQRGRLGAAAEQFGAYDLTEATHLAVAAAREALARA